MDKVDEVLMLVEVGVVDVELLVFIVDTEKVVAVLDCVLVEDLTVLDCTGVDEVLTVLDCAGVDEVLIVLVCADVDDDDDPDRRRAPHTPVLYDGDRMLPL